MSQMNTKKLITFAGLLPVVLVAALLFTFPAHAAVPGITGPSFSLSAGESFISQPDGSMVYSWGYGCSTGPSGFVPAAISGGTCPSMQIPGPTLIVHVNDTVVVTLTNNLPAAAGNTSILFPGFQATTGGGVAGL